MSGPPIHPPAKWRHHSRKCNKCNWKRARNAPKSYVEEQDELKWAFMEAGESDDEDDGGLLILEKKKTAEELLHAKKEEEEVIAEVEQRAKDAGIARKLDEYFGKDDDLDENDRFLKNYLMNKEWTEREDMGFNYGDVVGVSEDEEELEEQERYEAEYNFRFEEGVDDEEELEKQERYEAEYNFRFE